jgi:hypothetical protein
VCRYNFLFLVLVLFGVQVMQIHFLDQLSMQLWRECNFQNGSMFFFKTLIIALTWPGGSIARVLQHT